MGQSNFGAVTVDNIQGAGLIKLNGTSVVNAVHVDGSLISLHAQIGNLEVRGEANLTDTTIQNEGFVVGSIQAVRSVFKHKVTLLTQKAVFTGSTLEAITVQQDGACKGKQIIELKQKTIVNGPIVFESGKGEVLVYPGSQVLGQVTGGKIIKKS